MYVRFSGGGGVTYPHVMGQLHLLVEGAVVLDGEDQGVAVEKWDPGRRVTPPHIVKDSRACSHSLGCVTAAAAFAEPVVLSLAAPFRVLESMELTSKTY